MSKTEMMENTARNDRYTAILSEMVRTETISSRGETDLTKFYRFRELLRKQFPILFSVCEEEDFHGSMLLRWPGKDREKLPVMFLNHYDVVPAPGEWQHEPFCGEVFDGNLWGRGTIDTKSGLFGMLQAGEELASEGFVPSGDIYFESACNEETDGAGTEEIANVLRARGVRLAMSIDEGNMIEPDPFGCTGGGTYALVALGEKTSCKIRFTAKPIDPECYSLEESSPLVRMARFISEVRTNEPFSWELTPPVREAVKRMAPRMAEGIKEIMAAPEDNAELVLRNLPEIAPGLACLTRTTLAITILSGPDKGAGEVTAIGNVRPSHHEGRDAALKKIRKVAEQYGIEMEITDPGYPSGIADPDCDAFRLTEKAILECYPDIDGVLPYVMTGPTDSRFISLICDESIRFRPIRVNEQQNTTRHHPDENISVETLGPCVRFYRNMLCALSSKIASVQE